MLNLYVIVYMHVCHVCMQSIHTRPFIPTKANNINKSVSQKLGLPPNPFLVCPNGDHSNMFKLFGPFLRKPSCFHHRCTSLNLGLNGDACADCGTCKGKVWESMEVIMSSIEILVELPTTILIFPDSSTTKIWDANELI